MVEHCIFTLPLQVDTGTSPQERQQFIVASPKIEFRCYVWCLPNTPNTPKILAHITSAGHTDLPFQTTGKPRSFTDSFLLGLHVGGSRISRVTPQGDLAGYLQRRWEANRSLSAACCLFRRTIFRSTSFFSKIHVRHSKATFQAGLGHELIFIHWRR